MNRKTPDRQFMANINHQVSAITTLSPMKPWKAWWLRTFFFLRTHFPRLMGGGSELKNLSFIHFARWVVISRHAFPHLDDRQPREQLSYDYLLFCSNFNGTWDQYIDAFSHVVPVGMDTTFGKSEKYPKSIPTTPFKRYIRANQLETDYYYSAYPHATTNDVKRALHLSSEIQQLAAKSQRMAPEQFLREYERFLVRVQNDLAETGLSPGTPPATVK